MKIKNEFQIMFVEMSSLNEQMVSKFPDVWVNFDKPYKKSLKNDKILRFLTPNYR